MPIPAGHPHPGEDVRRSCFGSFFHDGGDVFLRILDEGQDGHHGDAGLDTVVRQRCAWLSAAQKGGGIGFDFGCQVVIGRRDGEADGGVNLIDAFDGLQVLEDEVALGNDVDRETELRDDFQCASHQVDLAFQGHVGIVHGAQTDDTLDALASELLAQQLDGILLNQHFTVEILNLVALGTAVAIYASVLAASVKVHVVLQPEIGIGLFGVAQQNLRLDGLIHYALYRVLTHFNLCGLKR